MSAIFYCNGMTTTRKEALEHAKTLANLTKKPVFLHHNNTTSIEKVKGTAGSFFMTVGTAVVSTLLVPASFPLAVGYAAATGLGVANTASRLVRIQKEKHNSAYQLAKKISYYLKTRPGASVTLVCHSQGAHIGEQALHHLVSLRHRIKVITIGGLVNIPDNHAAKVLNFHHLHDNVSQMVAPLYKQMVPLATCKGAKRSTIVLNSTRGHSASEYFKNTLVKKALTG